MPQLPSDRSYIFSEETDENSPNSVQTMQKIGSAINFLNDTFQQFEEFTSSGTFNVPEGVTKVLLYGWGGGGGGNRVASVCRGSSGARAYTKIVNVTPLSAVAVTIGGGGTGATNSSIFANNGGSTTFGSIATFEGGTGASSQLEELSDDSTRSLIRMLYSGSNVASNRNSVSGTRGFMNFENGNTRIGPEPHNGFMPPSSVANDFLRGGTGGGGLGGLGGAGIDAGLSAPANSGAGGGSSISASTGNGGSGYLLIAYSLA